MGGNESSRQGALLLGLCFRALCSIFVDNGWVAGRELGADLGLGHFMEERWKWVFECVLLERGGWGLMYGVDEDTHFKVFVRVK